MSRILKPSPLTLGLLTLLYAPLAAFAADPLPADADPSTETETANAATAPTTLDTISVLGKGGTRQVQSIGSEEISAAVPGTNPVKMLEKLPGVHFVASDPWGSYEWSNRIAIRGFEQRQLGYTLDGIPLGDNGYTSHNGLSPNRAILAENVAELELAQGAGALRIPSTSNLGGALVLHSSDPLTEFGGRVGLAIGSDNLRRGFVRLDTGEASGFSAYLSGMTNQVDKWKGHGVQEQSQLNGKALYAWDAGRVSLWLDYSDRNETDYQDMSPTLLDRCGYDWDNYAPDWDRAVAAANNAFSGCVTSKDDAYFAARGLREDWLSGLSGEFYLSDALTLKATGYYHRTEGQGHWFTPYIASATVPIALRITRYDLERSGFNSSLAYEVGNHTLEGGFWFEDSVHGAGRSFVDIDGPIDDQRYFTDFAGHLFRQRFDTATRQWYLQDTMRLLDDRLTVNVGFKGQKVETDATVVVPGRAGGRLVTEDNFLPQAGIAWKLDEHSDVFVNYAENQAAFRPGVSGAWSLGQASFDVSQAAAKPETSRSLELGWRMGTDSYQLSAAVYGVRFDDRQLVIVPCAGIISCANQFANVGSVSTRGAEFAFIWQPNGNLRWLNSLAYNDSQYDDDYVNKSYVNPANGSNIVPASGKQVVDTPKQLFATELSYGFGDFVARLGGKYTGERFYTYTNDAGVPGYWLWDAGISWERGDLGWAKSVKVALNAYNLADKEYVATLGSNGFRDTDAAGTFQTLLVGAPRQLFLSFDLQF